MDKRYQVFVSSTYDDLKEERQEIMQALLELDCIPAGMELFPATNDDQWTLIKRVIDDCDYYIVVIGGRYGSIGRHGKSYTQMEYEYATAQQKPVIAFLHKSPSDIPAKFTEKKTEGIVKLDEFRNMAQLKMCRFWSSPIELGSVVSRSLVKLIKSNPAVGWVKADLIPDQDSTEEILRLRLKIDELESRLAEIQPTNNCDEIAQGNDCVSINYVFSAYTSSKYVVDSTNKAIFSTTWNDIFSEISPKLIDEATEGQLYVAINQYIEASQYDTLQLNSKYKGCKFCDFKINPTDFDTLKIQLLALQLIAKSVRKKGRSVNDKSTYWTLTSAGEKLMTRLRAIKKNDSVDIIGVDLPF